MELNEILAQKTHGSIFRSRMFWHNEGEMSTKYFFAREKYNCNNKTMFGVHDENGIITTDHVKILKDQSKLYKKLYKVDPDINFKLENNSGIFVLEEDQKMLDLRIEKE